MSQILYYGGPILTMEEHPVTEAVLVENGTIRAVGERNEIQLLAGPDVKRVHLEGHTMMPAFIDSHSHITALARTISLLQLKKAESFDDICRLVREFVSDRKLKSGDWVIGFGYDHNFLKEKAHPDKLLLDKAAPGHPVLITHASGHMGVLSSAALKAVGITADTADPAGGKIGRCPGSREPNGYLEETAFIHASAKVPAPTEEQLCSQLVQAQKVYLEQGITTIQDGITKAAEWHLLKKAAEKGLFNADIVSFVDLESAAEIIGRNQKYVKTYHNRLKLGGYKIFLDGSPQSRTAWLTHPYLDAPDGYRGYPAHDDETVEQFVRTAAASGMQLLAHCNGDAAAEQFISACQRVPQIIGQRPVMIHAQLVRRDQLPAMAGCGMIASFFIAHIHYWGDIHRKNLGNERALYISPAASAQKNGVVFTFHQDCPVIPPNMLETVCCAVERKTEKGEVMGGSERIDVPAALRAVTLNAAYQYFEEHRKGSIAPGKLADFVVLDQNPLTCDPAGLDRIRIIQTIKEGKNML